MKYPGENFEFYTKEQVEEIEMLQYEQVCILKGYH